jgi:lysophospholipase L1-like esterase
MIFHPKNIISSFLLIIFACIFFSCSKANVSQMPVQTTDSTPVQNSNNDTVYKSYLALGDSYTIGQSVPDSDRYPVQTVKLLKDSGFYFSAPEIIATTGWTTADLQHAIGTHHFADSPYDIVTLLIGVNNQYQGRPQSEYTSQFTALLQKSIQLAGGKASHVIVISIPDYSVTPFASGRNDRDIIAAQIDSFNVINKQVSQTYGTKYLYITDETRKAATDPTLITSDGLHYSGKEYAIWAGKLSIMTEAILK